MKNFPSLYLKIYKYNFIILQILDNAKLEMHPNLLESDEIDSNLYPALLQVFAIILIGYLAGNFELLSRDQVLGLNKFVGTFALPALLFRSIAVLDFSSVDWLFMSSVFISKTIVFILAILVTIVTIRPVNIGLAAVFAIFVSQSNDFALGYPIVDAVYAKTHPDYLHYIYLIAPISLCILNPIAFLMMEANEALIKKRQYEEKSNNCLAYDTDEDEHKDESQESISSHDDLVDKKVTLDNLDQIDSIRRNGSFSAHEFRSLIRKKNTQSDKSSKKFSKLTLVKTTVWSTISNPIVFMTVIGIIANFILKQKYPL